jgi:ribulose bisphosphate carboxylase small subunit
MTSATTDATLAEWQSKLHALIEIYGHAKYREGSWETCGWMMTKYATAVVANARQAITDHLAKLESIT